MPIDNYSLNKQCTCLEIDCLLLFGTQAINEYWYKHLACVLVICMSLGVNLHLVSHVETVWKCLDASEKRGLSPHELMRVARADDTRTFK